MEAVKGIALRFARVQGNTTLQPWKCLLPETKPFFAGTVRQMGTYIFHTCCQNASPLTN